MKRFVFAMLAMAVGLVDAIPAHAGAVSELTLGTVNMLEDDNYEIFFNFTGPAGQINPGDRFLGTIRIQAVQAPVGNVDYNPSATQPTFTGVFALEAANIVTAGGFTTSYFKPLGTTDWSSTFGLDLPTPVNENTIAVFWDDLSESDTQVIGVSLQDSLDSFVGNNKIWEFGFAGTDFADDGISSLGEFFIAVGSPGTDTVGSNLFSIRNLMNLSLLELFDGPRLDPHTYLSNGTNEQAAQVAGVSFSNPAHLQAHGTIANSDPGSPWQFNTDTDLYILPVPEPSSLAIFAIGTLGGAVMVRNRRRKAVAQA